MTVIKYRTADVDGFKVFYREAGAANAPVLLLLHGFPTSSHMFRNLIPMLADRFRLVAPDLPGFGHSDMPAPADFAYTFQPGFASWRSIQSASRQSSRKTAMPMKKG
jgi:pimeloyl-ACP methyl ester carboxylesterase